MPLFRALAAALVMAAFATPAAPEEDAAILRAAFEAAQAPGFALALGFARADGAPEVLAGGPRHRGSAEEIGPDARWHIGSITKSFTATLIVRMAEDGALSLDAPIGTYLGGYAGEMHPDWRGVTLRALLSHTAGLPPNPPRRSLRAPESDDPSEDRRAVLRAMWGEPPSGTWGAFEYSNTGYMLAGLVAEQVAGAPWQALVTERLLTPLALSSAGFGAPKGTGDPFGHTRIFGIARKADPSRGRADNPAWMGPAGTLHMSLGDLLTWGQSHLRACAGADLPGLPGAAGCREMHRAGAGGYGLGWVLGKGPDGAQVIWHNGSNTMWHAIVMLLPEHDLVVAAAANVAQGARVEAAARALADALLAEATRP